MPMLSSDSIKQRLLHYSWDLAYGEFKEDVIFNGVDKHNLNIVESPYKNKWFADPFIYKDSSEQLELFVEEFDHTIGRGRIGHLKISKSSKIIESLSIILETDTHLSFPAIYRDGDGVYVHPENSASGKSTMYRYDAASDKLVDPVVVLEAPVTDAIIVKEDGHYLLYATRVPAPNGKELLIYKSDSFLGPYTLHQNYQLEKAYARNAGAFIMTADHKRLRPAQDCDGGDYGQAVHFMDGDKVVSSLTPLKPKYDGIHTFNTLGNTFIVDLKRYDFPMIYRLKNLLRK